jgi:catechol 2,3-dioxygenase-like lactoylglutathione lyase family enzyme
MFDHVSIGVRDLARTKRFYDAALKPLGYKCTSESPGSLGYGAKSTGLWISPTKSPVPADEASGLHFCFAAPNTKAVARPAPRIFGQVLRRLRHRSGWLSDRSLLRRLLKKGVPHASYQRNA